MMAFDVHSLLVAVLLCRGFVNSLDSAARRPRQASGDPSSTTVRCKAQGSSKADALIWESSPSLADCERVPSS
jgi:hypothetical protein